MRLPQSVMCKCDTQRRTPQSHCRRRIRAAFGIIGNVFVQLFQVLKRCILSTHLRQTSNDCVGGARKRRMRHYNPPTEHGVEQVIPGLRKRQLFLRKGFLIIGKADRTHIARRPCMCRILIDVRNLLQPFRLIRFEQPLFCNGYIVFA